MLLGHVFQYLCPGILFRVSLPKTQCGNEAGNNIFMENTTIRTVIGQLKTTEVRWSLECRVIAKSCHCMRTQSKMIFLHACFTL